jgi:hypothetical protein
MCIETEAMGAKPQGGVQMFLQNKPQLAQISQQNL